MSDFNLKIYASDHTVYDGMSKYVNVPTSEGLYGILGNHRNTIMLIETGKLSFKNLEDEKTDVIVSRGLLKVENGQVLILVETAEKPEDIDINRALKAEESAKAQLKKKLSDRELSLIYAKLARSFSRVQGSKNKYK